MTVETLSKEAAKAVEYFENKLNYEYGPVGLKYAIKNNEPLTIIDLRTPDRFEKSHIPGALNISFEELERTTDGIDRNTTAVVYCYGITCHLATKAALLLAKRGFKVKELFGGFDEWAAAELPLEGALSKSCGTSACAS